MIKVLLLIGGVVFLLGGILSLAWASDRLMGKDDSFLSKHATRKDTLFQEYIVDLFGDKAYRTIEFAFGIIVGVFFVMVGFNSLLKWLISPYEPGFWILF